MGWRGQHRKGGAPECDGERRSAADCGPCSCPRVLSHQFCTVEYLISASLAADSSTTAACSWLRS